MARFNRLRDLHGRERALAAALLALVLVPFVVALVRAFHDGWVPSGDEANIATRALDVFSRHPPLTGLPSTSGAYGAKIRANHPGPLEFYVLAAPLRAFGASAGPLFTAAAINAACCLLALWVCFRRLGLAAMSWATVVVLAVIWSAGTAVLTDTLSSNMTMYSLLATAVLAWAVIDGDVRLLPLAVVVSSYAAQQHLATALIVAVLVAAVVITLTVRIVRRIRAGEPAIPRAARGFAIASGIVAAVCWLPVLYDELPGHSGNLTRIVRFAGDNGRQSVGIHAAFDQAMRVVAPPTLLARTDTTGLYFLRGANALAAVVGLAVVALIVAIAVRVRARSQSVARLAAVTLLLLAAGILDGSGVPAGAESWRVNLYRWAWAAAFLTWTTIGVGIGPLVASVRERSTERSTEPASARSWADGRGAMALVLVSALLVTTIVVVHGPDDHNRELPAFAAERHIVPAILRHVDRSRPVVVVPRGLAAGESVAPYVIFRLVQAGLDVQVAPFLTSWYGRNRRYRPKSDPGAVVISSTGAPLPTLPGTRVATIDLSPERRALTDALVAQGRNHPITLAPGADRFLRKALPEYPGLAREIRRALSGEHPATLRELLSLPVYEPAILELARAGKLHSPTLDRKQVQRLLALAPDNNPIGNDQRIDVRILTPAQVKAARLPGLPRAS